MCIIDHDNKIIYIAIPKTGTTSTEAFLKTVLSKNSMTVNTKKKLGLHKHSKGIDIKLKIKNFSDYHSIAVIRNPYDWFVSWYTYRQRLSLGTENSTKNMSFKDYLERQTHVDILSYISDDDNNIIVDSIIRYEDNIENEIIKLLDQLSIIKGKKIIKDFPKKNI